MAAASATACTLDEHFERARDYVTEMADLQTRIAELRARRDGFLYAGIERYRPARDVPATPPVKVRGPSLVERRTALALERLAKGDWPGDSTLTYREFEGWVGLSERPARKVAGMFADMGILTITPQIAGQSVQAVSITATPAAQEIAARLNAEANKNAPAPGPEAEEARVPQQRAYGWRSAVIDATGLSPAWWQRRLERLDRAGTEGYPPRSEWNLPAVPELENEAAYWAKVKELSDTANALARQSDKLSADLDDELAPVFAAVPSNKQIADAIGMDKQNIAKRRRAWRERMEANQQQR